MQRWFQAWVSAFAVFMTGVQTYARASLAVSRAKSERRRRVGFTKRSLARAEPILHARADDPIARLICPVSNDHSLIRVCRIELFDLGSIYESCGLEHVARRHVEAE